LHRRQGRPDVRGEHRRPEVQLRANRKEKVGWLAAAKTTLPLSNATLDWLNRLCVAQHCTSTILVYPASARALGAADGAYFAARTAACVKQVGAVGLEPAHAHPVGHGEPGENLAALGVDAADLALVALHGAVPELAIDPSHPGDEAVGLDGAQDCAGL